MAFYWIFWALFLIMFITWNKRINHTQDAILNVIIVVLAFFVGCRIEVGADWGSYVGEYYNSIHHSMIDVDDYREPIFLLLAKTLCVFGLPYPWFFFSLAMIQMFCLKKAGRMFGINTICLTFFMFFSLFFCMTTLNVLRHGIMVVLIWVALGYRSLGNNKKFVLCVLLAAGFHFMALIVSPFLFLIDKRLSKMQMLICVVAGFVGLSIGLSQHIFRYIPYSTLFEDRLTYYMSDAFLSKSLSLTAGQIFDLCVMLFMFFLFHKQYENDRRVRILVNALLYSFIVGCLLNYYGVFVERISQIFKFALIFLVPLIYDLYYSGSPYKIMNCNGSIQLARHRARGYKGIVTFLIIVYSFLYMDKAINTPDPNQQKPYQFLPYKIDVTNYFQYDQ